MSSSALQTLAFSLRYWAADHPAIANFRWDHKSWGSSWIFLASSILLYLILIPFLRLSLLFRRSPLPLGPIPALYNAVLLLASLCMFVGCWQSAAVEIEETRWLWRRFKTAPEWILCFPLGIRPAGRVFFWSYVFYLSKYYEFLETFILIMKKQPPTLLHISRRAAIVIMCFLWLTFTQSLQILALLVNAGLNVIMCAYSVLSSIGMMVPPWKNVVRHCQVVQFTLMFAASMGLLRLQFKREGCSGFGAWLFNALLNAMLLPLMVLFNRRQDSEPAELQARRKLNSKPLTLQKKAK